jgi:hypothetical protein
LTIAIGLTIIVSVTPVLLHSIRSAYAFIWRDVIDAPIAASENHVYITWVTNKTGNRDVMSRASNDDDKINLNNSPNANSI